MAAFGGGQVALYFKAPKYFEYDPNTAAGSQPAGLA